MGQRTESRLPSPERLDEFLALVRAGNYITVACSYTGISHSAVYAWRRESANPDARSSVVDFVDRLDEAEAFAEAAMLQIVTRAAHAGTWQAGAWYLERRAPKRWGRSDRHELDVRVAEPTTNVRSQLALAIAQLGEDLAEDVIDVPPPAPPAEPPGVVLPLRRPDTG